MTTYAGKVCDRHPELAGLRRTHSRECLACYKGRIKKYRKESSEAKKWRKGWESTPERRAKKAMTAAVRNQRPDLKVRRNIAFMERKRHIDKRATPAWADLSGIEKVYERMRKKNSDGGEYEVDHIVPLKGANVCGLHVHNNLRVVRAEINRGKGNRHDN